jgi:hypothetical protein
MAWTMEEFVRFLVCLPLLTVFCCLCWFQQRKKQAQPVLPPYPVTPQPYYQNPDEFWPSAVIATGVELL